MVHASHGQSKHGTSQSDSQPCTSISSPSWLGLGLGLELRLGLELGLGSGSGLGLGLGLFRFAALRLYLQRIGGGRPCVAEQRAQHLYARAMPHGQGERRIVTLVVVS